ncbi:hypothetical protein K431DRAFT_246690 [Polychaeton citri CBS 116435]|uniref:RING-type domain-containing protein n=1 Tax=Polychaeton citri CBS 116435 TaxID=1314669 RepID=A0A9P4Q8I9_9PEZI|nr:hypothetical protein K431DRAFT_246690 [Polychaeton citri CBS 116435]
MSHSKRNTSLAFFTNHERAELKGTWGSRQARLNREAFLPFGSCQLCLLPSRDAVACPDEGHLFCRECALSNVLAQKEEMKRLKRDEERRNLEDADEKVSKEAEKAAKELEDFERVQAGGSDRSSAVKRKQSGDEDDELARMAKEGGIYSGKRQKREETSFWTPEAIPDDKKREAQVIRSTPRCPSSTVEKPHEISLKSLINVHFAGEGKNEGSWRMCPACDKPLSNSTKAVVAKPCGHVCCRPCSDKFQTPPEKTAHEKGLDDAVRCYVCQEDITPGRKVRKNKDKDKEGRKDRDKRERGLITLSCDGTGFAGGGRAEVVKQGVAFQC